MYCVRSRVIGVERRSGSSSRGRSVRVCKETGEAGDNGDVGVTNYKSDQLYANISSMTVSADSISGMTA